MIRYTGAGKKSGVEKSNGTPAQGRSPVSKNRMEHRRREEVRCRNNEWNACRLPGRRQSGHSHSRNCIKVQYLVQQRLSGDPTRRSCRSMPNAHM
jgi:hypothetical protein